MRLSDSFISASTGHTGVELYALGGRELCVEVILVDIIKNNKCSYQSTTNAATT